MTTKKKKSVTAPGFRHVRLYVPSDKHDELRVLRAKSDKDNNNLFIDMMRVYAKHEKEWSKNAPKIKATVKVPVTPKKKAK